MALPSMGTIAYGDTTFGVTSKSSIRSTPVWDDARMTIVAWDHRIHVRGYVTPAGAADTDTEMATLHAQLETPAQRLRYDDNMGWGGLDVNGPGEVKDVAWGPHPELVSFVPLGGGSSGNQAALVEWNCSTRLPTCIGGARYEKELMAYNSEWNHTIDGAGLAKISISGYLEIALTRKSGSRNINDWADKYRDKLEQIKDPTGFRREHQTYTMSSDRRRLNFSWQWVELPYPLPDGCPYADVDHELSWQLGPKAGVSRNVFSGSITVAPNKPMSIALDKWKLIVADRVKTQRHELGKVILAGKLDGDPKKMHIIDTVTMREKIVGEGIGARTAHFYTSYTVLGESLANLLKASGMWKPVIGFDHAQWRASLLDSTFHIRGAGQVSWDTNETIIDLCANGPNPETELRNKPEPGQAALRAGPGVEVMGVNFNRDLVPKESSWIAYECAVIMGEDNSKVMHKPLVGSDKVKTTEKQSEEIGSPNQPSNRDQVGSFGKAAEATHPNESTDTKNVFQQVGAPTVTVWLVGKALRLGHQIPTPRLDKVAGQESKQMWQQCPQWTASVVAGIPIFCKTWVIEYQFEKPPSSMPVAENPAFQTPAYQSA